MRTIRVDQGKIVKDDSGVIAKALYSSEEAVIIHIELAPGARIDPHVTSVDMEFFVLEGNGTFILGEESAAAGAGTLVLSPRGVPHGMRNAGPASLRVLTIKNPRPAGEGN